MKKLSFVALLLVVFGLMSCERVYVYYVTSYYLENHTNDTIFVQFVTKDNLCTTYAITPYERFKLNKSQFIGNSIDGIEDPQSIALYDCMVVKNQKC